MTTPKVALLMGSLYAPPNELGGTLNDVEAMTRVLVPRAFNVQVLFGPDATKANMIEAMTSTVAQIGPDGVGVIYWSGHGTTGPTTTPDPNELGPSSEAWCPHDFRTAGMLWDDQIGAILSGIHPRGRGVLISDSCYARQVSRLADPIGAASTIRAKFIDPARWVAEMVVARAKAAGRPLTPEGLKAEVGRVLNAANTERALAGQTMAEARAANRPFPWVELSACQDNQVAWCVSVADGHGGATARGAFTWALEQAMDADPRTYAELMLGSRHRMGVVATASNPGFLPSADLANQTPAIIASPGRARWRLFAAAG